MSDLHTYKVMQEGDADGKSPRPAFGWPAALISVLLVFVGATILYPVFTGGGIIDHKYSALSNAKQLALANLLYATDYDEHLPSAENWMDALELYTKNEWAFRDPDIKDRKDDEYGYAFFKPLSCVDTRTVLDPDQVPLVFQSVLMLRNARSDLSTLPAIPRNGKANCVAFLDGHVRSLPPTWPNGPITIVIDPSPDEGGAKE